MSAEALKANLATLIQTLLKAKPSSAKGTYLRGAAISSTMGVGVRLDVNELAKTGETV
jgi:large subunit ribosomal protein L1